MSNEHRNDERSLAEALNSMVRLLSDMIHRLERALDQVIPSLATKTDLNELEQRLDMKSSELAQGLTDLQTQVQKVAEEQRKRADELAAKIAELEQQLADADVPQTVTDAFANVKSAVQVLDDTIPDAATP